MQKRIIKRSAVVGYCMGVKKAVDSAIKMREEYPTSCVYTLGHLIHNPITLKKLEKLGIKILNENDLEGDILKQDDVVIIRAHGVHPKIIKKLKEKKAIIIDCTCSRVVANRHLAEKCSKQGTVILAGDKNHPELISIQGYVLENKDAVCFIIQNATEAEEIEIKNTDSPFFLIAQTTIKKEEFDLIKNILKNRLSNLKVFNTICSATFERQDALKHLINEVDAVLVIGGKTSANTKRLFTTAQEKGKPAFFVENVSDIPQEVYKFHSIGLASGASTPDEIIEKIENILLENS